MANRQEMIAALRRADMIAKLREQDAAKAAEPDQVMDEMPEWLGTLDRTAVKNATNNDEEAISYLQRQYPDAEFKSQGGEIIARKKGEKEYGRLDPSFSPISNPLGTLKDLGRDVLDIGYDVLQGGAEAAGTAAGALAGLGAGSLPAAVAGGAAGGAAASTLKEALRKKLGMTDEMSGSSIALDAALGGAVPVAFRGAGKALGFGAKKVAPWLYSKATGISTGALDKISRGAGEMSDTEALDVIKGARESVGDYIQNSRKDFSNAFNAIRGSGTKVDVDPVVSKIDSLIKEAESSGGDIGFLRERVSRLKALKDRVLSSTATPDKKLTFDPTTGNIDIVQPEFGYIKGKKDISDVMDLKSRTNAEFLDYDNHLNNGFGSGNTISAEERRGAKELVKSLDNAIYGNDPAGQQLKKDFGEAVQAADYLDSKFFTDDKAQFTLRNLRKGKDRVLKGQVSKLPDKVQNKLQDSIERLEIADFFNNPEQGNYIKKQTDNIFGKTPLSKVAQAGGALAGYLSGGGYAGSAIGGLAGRKLGDFLTSPEAVKAITRFARDRGIKTETAMKAIANDPKLMSIIYGSTYAGMNR
jgi:hypothetical protein